MDPNGFVERPFRRWGKGWGGGYASNHSKCLWVTRNGSSVPTYRTPYAVGYQPASGNVSGGNRLMEFAVLGEERVEVRRGDHGFDEREFALAVTAGQDVERDGFHVRLVHEVEVEVGVRNRPDGGRRVALRVPIAARSIASSSLSFGGRWGEMVVEMNAVSAASSLSSSN